MRVPLVVGLIAGLVGFLAGWALLAVISKPTEQAYLQTTTSLYFKEMSERGYNSFASYSDCKVEEGDDLDKRQGHPMIGACSANSETLTVFFMVAMTTTAQIAYSDWEERTTRQ